MQVNGNYIFGKLSFTFDNSNISVYASGIAEPEHALV